MKYIRPQKGGHGVPAFVFQISRQEMEWLLGILKFYPHAGFRVYHQITQGAAEEIKAEQELLEDAMAQQRLDHKRKLEQFFRHAGTFSAGSAGSVSLHPHRRANGMAVASDK